MSATRMSCWCAPDSEIFAIDAYCSHYHGPLADGLVVGTASAVPGITPASICAAAKPRARRRSTRFRSGRSSTRAIASSSGKSASSRSRAARLPWLRRTRSSSSAAAPRDSPRPKCCGGRNYRGSIVMLSSDAAPPVDRPNLSKDYLAGSAPEDWLPLRPDEFLRGSAYRPAAQDRCRLDRQPRRATSSSPAAARSPTTAFCWRPAPSRCGCRFRAPTSRMSIRCARSAIAAPSSMR